MTSATGRAGGGGLVRLQYSMAKAPGSHSVGRFRIQSMGVDRALAMFKRTAICAWGEPLPRHHA